MTRIERLQTVQGVLGDRVERAATALASARMRLDEAERRLSQLRQFREDYQSGMTSDTGTSISAFRLRDFNAFIARLDTALGQQAHLIGELRRDVARAQQHWLSERQRAEALDKVVAGHQSREEARLEAAEQQASDELSAQRFSHRQP